MSTIKVKLIYPSNINKNDTIIVMERPIINEDIKIDDKYYTVTEITHNLDNNNEDFRVYLTNSKK